MLVDLMNQGESAIRPWLADESPLNDLDEAESEIEVDDGETLPDEVLEQLEKAPAPPAPIPDPGVM